MYLMDREDATLFFAILMVENALMHCNILPDDTAAIGIALFAREGKAGERRVRFACPVSRAA